MRQHRALAAPGRAAGVDDRREVVGLLDGDLMPVALSGRPLQQAAAAVVVKGEHMRHRATGALRAISADPADVAARTHDERRLGIADEVLDLAALVGGIERQVDEAGAQHRQVQHQGLDRLLGLHGDSRARGQVERREQVRDPRGAALEVAPGVDEGLAVAAFDRHRVEIGGKGLAQRDEQVVVVVQGQMRKQVTAGRAPHASA